MALRNLDPAQRVLLRNLLLREQNLIRGTLRMSLFGSFAEETVRKAELIDRTLKELEHGTDG